MLSPVLGIRDAAGNKTDTGCQGRWIDSAGKETKNPKVSSRQAQMMYRLCGQQKQGQETLQQHTARLYRLQLPPEADALGFCEDHWASAETHQLRVSLPSWPVWRVQVVWAPGHQGRATPLCSPVLMGPGHCGCFKASRRVQGAAEVRGRV